MLNNVIYCESNNKLKGLEKGGKYMQQMLQQLFDRECRNYAFYMQKLKVIEGQCDELNEREDQIFECKEAANKISEISRLLKSEEFLRVKDKLDLPENFNTFEKTFSNYKLDKDYTDELRHISRSQESLKPFIKVLRECVKDCRQILFYYIEMASENKMKFTFHKDNKIAREIFILYYRDRFKFEQRRNVIEIERCKLNEDFMRAYTAETITKDEAYDWFEIMAQKYEGF